MHPASLSAFLTLGSWELFITSIFAACSLLRWSPSETLMSSRGIHRGQGELSDVEFSVEATLLGVAIQTL